MSEEATTERAGDLLDYPNMQVLGLDPPWVEGTGGGEAPVPTAETTEAPEPEPAPPEPEGEGEDEG